MGATQIQDALPGEDLIGIEPELLQQVDAGWLQRLALFTGRTLSDTALDNEQQYRAGRFTLLGQAVTQGTVQGFDLSVNLSPTDPVLTVAPGYGISATGQDVTLLRVMQTKLSGLAVIDGVSGGYLADFSHFTPPAAPWAGVLLLQAIVAQVPGSAVDTGSNNIIVSGNLDASCDQDPSENAFGDSQIVDGVRLVLATWPSLPALALPPALPAADWRNRLVYTIFNAELALGADDRLPWEFLGVPLALAAFGPGSKLLFTDRGAVVRSGGLPRRRYIIPSDGQLLATVQPALANARVNQFAEQLGADLTRLSPPGLVASEFAFLPPAGILPTYTMDFSGRIALWCPSNWTVTAAPVYAEELEGSLQAGITAAPLNTKQNESIEILLPLPDEVYDPNVLLTEQADPAFQVEVDAAKLARNTVLQHRKVIQLESNALALVLAQPAIDPDAGLTQDEITARDGQALFTPIPAESFGTDLNNGTYSSSNVEDLLKEAATNYTVTYTDPVTGKLVQLPLINDLDKKDLHDNGLQHFIDTINAKLDKANDLLDLAFLTVQTDIYRYRQNVLGTTNATRLAVSPILAEIALGSTATTTAQNIQSYLASVKFAPPTTGAAGTPASATTPPADPAGNPVAAPVTANRTEARASTLSLRTISPIPISPALLSTKAAVPEMAAGPGGLAAQIIKPQAFEGFTPITVGTVSQPASPTDITQQSPIVGAQLNLRTMTIGDRLQLPPTQEALFYSVGNRTAFLKLLATLEITIADLPVLADIPAGSVPPVMADFLPASDYLHFLRSNSVFEWITKPAIYTPPQVATDPDEGTLFSSGIHVLEQHSQLLRAVEGRIQQYRDFLSLCTTALATIQGDYQSAQTLLSQLQNDLTQTRQNLAFVNALLLDEKARVDDVNATRTNVLNTYVQFVAYTRVRTLPNTGNVHSRQLMPGNVTSPVPACLKQSVAVPPELREMVALLREGPVYWFPAIQTQVGLLERPSLLQNLAVASQARATMLLQLPPQTSSAENAPGVYARAISSIYTARQQTLRGFQTQRAAFQPAQLANQSWTAQVSLLQSVVAVGDLQSSDAVHAEIASAAARTMQQISSVATCLYTRIGQARPVDRLAWAEFLRGSGASVALNSLAVLPGWNSQNYVDRQQMQLLVDWLFQQVVPTDPDATALMTDLVAVAILLASHAPVDNIIAGAVALRTRPVVGGPIRLTLPSQAVAHGMTVQLYSAGKLSARAVVSDLDNTGVTATITGLYDPAVTFQANDVAHYSTLASNAVVYKAFTA